MSSRLLVVATVAVAAGALVAGCRGKGSAKKDDPVRSKAAFAAMGEVLTHPRCMNCHPSGDSPTQDETMAAHQPPVFRGEAGLGAVGMRCNTCHGEANVPLTEKAGTMPGIKGWHLAPRSMGWQGKSLAEICDQLKDKSRNGGKTLDQIHHHMADDLLVGWAWAPGDGRAPAPGTRAQFAKNTRDWVDGGAHCPDS